MSYQQDFYAWTMEQAQCLRSGLLNKLDIDNLIEEIESMGRSEKRALESCLARLLQHLLKWQCQPMLRNRSWSLTVKNQRREVAKILRDNPSLKSKLDEVLPDAYETAKSWAEIETGLAESVFPEENPYSFAQLMDADFLPD